MSVTHPVKSIAALVVAGVVLSACSTPDVTSAIHDPFEVQSRKTHAGSKKLDRKVLRPIAMAYGEILPEPVRIGVSNFSANLSLPGTIVNDVLQLNIEDAAHNTLRFLVNTTIGLGGVMDPAQAAGAEPRPSDFGETLHVWGAQEGAYIELPVLGPSTTRDAVGKVVDYFLDPVSALVPPELTYVKPAAGFAATVGSRYRFQNTVDSLLYDSADSYAQTRLLYLENRRFDLGIESTEDDDLYEGLYDDLIPQ
jgi:phospholipid-binding lipoprotein MlaA